MIEPTIRAVVYREGEWWIIQGLEYDFVTATKRLEDVAKELRRFVLGQIAASIERGIEPFRGFKRASRRYWDLYEKAAPWGEPAPPLNLPAGLGLGPSLDTRLAA